MRRSRTDVMLFNQTQRVENVLRTIIGSLEDGSLMLDPPLKREKTMRPITDHLTGSKLNEALRIDCDEGTKYHFSVKSHGEWVAHGAVKFHEGELGPEGPNGVGIEALLAVAIDRLRIHQSGPCACRENAIALTKLEESLMWLGHRTKDRQQRGVEGKAGAK